MPLGIVSDKDFERELADSTDRGRIKADIPSIEPMKRPGRSIGDTNVPDSLRKIIGETSQIEGREAALNLAADFGISPSSVSAYSNGSTSTDSYDKQPNLNHINAAKERISRKARAKLFKSLNHLTDDKLASAKAVDIASVARAMSAIVKEMEPETPKNPDGDKQGPTFVFYSPQIKTEKHYDVINAKE